MKMKFYLEKSNYDCRIHIADNCGGQEFLIQPESSLDVEVCGDSFELTVVPVLPTGIKKTTLFGRIKSDFENSVNNMLLQVGCTYRICDIESTNEININERTYTAASPDRHDILDLMPVEYAFFEISSDSGKIELSNAFSVNYKKFLRNARGFMLLSSDSVLLYPAQIGCIKRLIADKYILEALHCFFACSFKDSSSFRSSE